MDNNQNNNPKNKKTAIILTATLLLVFVVGVFWMVNAGKNDTQVISPTPVNNGEIVLRVTGSENAIITISEFSDFGCITCRAWHQAGIKDQILAKYGEQVNFVWRDFPVITANSPKAAEAGFCAYDQERFWDYHDLVYENYPRIGVDQLKQYADDIGLNAQEFNECLDSEKYKGHVKQELQEALSHGFRGTPSFLVNDQKLIGPPSFEQISAIIDEMIATSN